MSRRSLLLKSSNVVILNNTQQNCVLSEDYVCIYYFAWSFGASGSRYLVSSGLSFGLLLCSALFPLPALSCVAPRRPMRLPLNYTTSCIFSQSLNLFHSLLPPCTGAHTDLSGRCLGEEPELTLLRQFRLRSHYHIMVSDSNLSYPVITQEQQIIIVYLKL